MVVSTHTHGASVVLFAGIYLVDAAAFSLGQYRSVFESVYREVEWAVLSIFAQPTYVILNKKSSLNLRECSNDGR